MRSQGCEGIPRCCNSFAAWLQQLKSKRFGIRKMIFFFLAPWNCATKLRCFFKKSFLLCLSSSSYVSAIQRWPCFTSLTGSSQQLCPENHQSFEFHHTTWDTHNFKGGKNFRAPKPDASTGDSTASSVYEGPEKLSSSMGVHFQVSDGFSRWLWVFLPEIQHKIRYPKISQQ